MQKIFGEDDDEIQDVSSEDVNIQEFPNLFPKDEDPQECTDMYLEVDFIQEVLQIENISDEELLMLINMAKDMLRQGERAMDWSSERYEDIKIQEISDKKSDVEDNTVKL